MAGFEQELIQYQSTYSKRYDLVSDDVPSLPTATGKQEASGIIGHWATRSFLDVLIITSRKNTDGALYEI